MSFKVKDIGTDIDVAHRPGLAEALAEAAPVAAEQPLVPVTV